MNLRSKQNTYHVTNENIAPSEVTDNVGDERGDAFGASPSLVSWIFLEYYLGVPWAYPSLGYCHSLFSSYRHLIQNLKTSITQNLTELCEIGYNDKEQTISLWYCNELILYLYWC